MIRLAAVADLHVHAAGEQALREMLDMVQSEADVLVVAGDLTDTGLESEARVLASALDDVTIPVVGVLGNHDFHHEQQVAIQQVLDEHGMILLDGEGWTFEHDGLRLGLAGCVGFGGGFRPYNLTSFGEPEWKYLYQKVVEESRKLERALAAVHDADHIIAITHYSPTVETMGDEPEALYSYLGSSELGDALERHRVLFALHGHAHRGFVQGLTMSGVPVFNVSLPVVQQPVVWEIGGDGSVAGPTPVQAAGA